MEWQCPNCGEDNSETAFPFGDPVKCGSCGKIFETEWDYVSWDNLASWVTNAVIVPDTSEERTEGK